MTLIVALHEPTKARANVFSSNGRIWGCVDFADEAGHEVKLFTTPEAARALVAAFNAAMASEEAAA